MKPTAPEQMFAIDIAPTPALAYLFLVGPTSWHALRKMLLSLTEPCRSLARDSAVRDIVVSKLHADWADFGCWELQVERGSELGREENGVSPHY
jgi:hypothetical protein